MRENVECSFCGTQTNRQPAGDGCHACSKGTMKLYDSDASQHYPYDIACYEAEADQYRDETVYENFQEAKRAALQRLKLQQDDILKRIAVVEKTHKQNCKEIRNPFNT